MQGGGGIVSSCLPTYGGSLLLAPEGVDLAEIGGFYTNKFLKTRPAAVTSSFAKISKMREKMSRVGASEHEIEDFVLE